MKQSPPPKRSQARASESAGAASLTDLVPPAIGRVIANSFRRMTVAEDEIRAAKARHPRKAAKLDQAFRYLCPPALLGGLDDMVYRAHAREILERVAKGGKLRPGTTAEVVAALSHGSQVAPPGRIEMLLYTELFARLFPKESLRLMTDSRPAAPDRYERERMRELEQELRRKLAQDRGPIE